MKKKNQFQDFPVSLYFVKCKICWLWHWDITIVTQGLFPSCLSMLLFSWKFGIKNVREGQITTLKKHDYEANSGNVGFIKLLMVIIQPLSICLNLVSLLHRHTTTVISPCFFITLINQKSYSYQKNHSNLYRSTLIFMCLPPLARLVYLRKLWHRYKCFDISHVSSIEKELLQPYQRKKYISISNMTKKNFFNNRAKFTQLWC